jgi:hypothetical protein
MCSKVEAENFRTLVYSVLLDVGRNKFKVTEILWEKKLNCERCMNHAYKFHCYCSYIFREKNWRLSFRTAPRISINVCEIVVWLRKHCVIPASDIENQPSFFAAFVFG